MGYFVTDVTAVTAKNKSPVYMCVHAREEDMRSSKRKSVQAKVLQPADVSVWRKAERIHLVCEIYVAKYGVLKGKSAVFCDFFTLCPHFNAYIFRGGCVRKGAKRGRTEKGSSMRPIEK